MTPAQYAAQCFAVLKGVVTVQCADRTALAEARYAADTATSNSARLTPSPLITSGSRIALNAADFRLKFPGRNGQSGAGESVSFRIVKRTMRNVYPLTESTPVKATLSLTFKP